MFVWLWVGVGGWIGYEPMGGGGGSGACKGDTTGLECGVSRSLDWAGPFLMTKNTRPVQNTTQRADGRRGELLPLEGGPGPGDTQTHTGGPATLVRGTCCAARPVTLTVTL